MIVALGLIIATRAMIGIDDSPIGWVTTIVAVLFAIFTGLRLWLGAPLHWH
jgi:type IV secretory pathway VirB2 component (pilin)